MSANLFYVDLFNGIACKSASGDALAFSDWVAGGTVSFGLRFLDYVGGFNEVDADIASLRVSVGAIDARPLSGRYKIKIGAAASNATNTTAFLDWNASAPTIQAALNSLPARANDFSCDAVPGGVVIRRDDGAAQVLTVVSNRLSPRSFGRVTGSEIDGEWIYELRLTVAPLAFSDSAARVLPEAPSISTIQDGGCDPSGTTFWNEIQALHIPPNFRGTYQVRYGNYKKTALLDSTDGPTQLQEAINKILSDGTVLGKVQVTNPTTDTAHIEFMGDLAGTDVPQMTVHVYSAPPGDWTFSLALDRAEMFEALRENASLLLPFEAEADFYIDPDNHLEGTVTRKLWQTTVKVNRPQIWPDMQTVPGVDWLFQNPQDYVPFTPDQIVTGPQTYSAVIGTGEATTIAVTHGLGTSNIANIVVRENTSAWTLKNEGSDYFAAITDENVVTLVFPTAPASASLIVYVSAAAAERDWEPHTHTIEQVVGLRTILDDYGSRMERLEAILPSTGPGASSSQSSGIEIALPETKDILFFKGTNLNALFGETGADASKLGRAPMMLPAVHAATPTSYSGGNLPAIAAGSVWQNTTGAALEMGRGIYGGRVLGNGFFASDGRVRYAVDHAGTSTSYFPTGFDRELWRIFVNEKMLRLNRTLNVQFGLALQLLNATSNAQWLLVIEHGTAPSQSSPSTTAMNLENIVWNATPGLAQRLILTANRQTHSFGARIRRALVSTVDTITMDTLLYGVWEGADSAAPSGANFALRARLIEFDTENALANDSRGWVAYEILGADKGGKPTAVIT